MWISLLTLTTHLINSNDDIPSIMISRGYMCFGALYQSEVVISGVSTDAAVFIYKKY